MINDKYTMPISGKRKRFLTKNERKDALVVAQFAIVKIPRTMKRIRAELDYTDP